MGVRRLETLRQFQVDFFGFSAFDVNRCLQATFDFEGKRHQRKRHDEPQHRQPESAASDPTASLRGWHHHGKSASKGAAAATRFELKKFIMQSLNRRMVESLAKNLTR
jgi:hypothetical protein